MSYPSPEFEGQCTGFPDRVWGPRGTADLNRHCRTHDWHYQILRDHHEEWPEEDWDNFKQWADACLYAGVRLELRRAWGPWVGSLIARAMWRAVRSKLGEAAADGSW